VTTIKNRVKELMRRAVILVLKKEGVV